MYGHNATQANEYNKRGKMSMQSNVTVNSQYLSSSQHRNSKKFDSSHRQKVSENILPFQNSSNLVAPEKTGESGVTNHASKSSHERNKHCKVQGALRGCGNWSEHVSSSGKKYFYNNVSEVSQWEKPRDWNDGSAISLKDKGESAARRSASKNHHHARQINTEKPNEKTDIDKNGDGRKNFYDRDYRNKSSAGGGSDGHDYKDIDYRDISGSQNSDAKTCIRRSTSTDKDCKSLNLAHSSLNCRFSSIHVETSKSRNSGVVGNHETCLPSTGEFYDYSAWSGKSSQSQVLNDRISNGSSQASQHSVEGDATTNKDHAGSTNSKKSSLSASSEFMQKLSNVLTQAATTSNNNSYKSKANIQNVFRLLLNAATKSRNEKSSESDGRSLKNGMVDSCDTPPAKRIRLVAPESETKPSSNAGSAATEIEPSHSEFKSLEDLQSVFDPSLILQVQNWPAEHHEEQCQRLSENFHRFMADSMPELSASLTSARSKVRSSEILSTLQEQRILYIRQQIKDLERSSTSSGPFT